MTDEATTGRAPGRADGLMDELRRPRAMSVALALVAAVLVAGVVVGVLRGGTGTYESRVVLLVDQTNAVVAAESDGVLAKLNAVRAKYQALARSRIVVDEVADELDESPGAVAGALFVDSRTAALTLAIGARTDDPVRSQQIAAAGAEALVEYVDDEQSEFNVPSGARITLEPLAEARPGVELERETSTVVLAAGLAAGLAAALVYLLLQLRAARVALR